MLTANCPKCGEPVIRSPVGDLEPHTTQFGIRKADGSRLTSAEHSYGLHTGRYAGYMLHACPPPPPPLALF